MGRVLAASEFNEALAESLRGQNFAAFRALKEEEPKLLRDLQQSLGKQVTIKPDVHLHHEQFDVMAT